MIGRYKEVPAMPKFLIQGSYSPEGLRALSKDKASGRQAAVKDGLATIGGKLEGLYYALGDSDVYVFCDCPDHVTAAAMSLAASSSGLIRTKVTALLTVEETDQAIAMKTAYRAPGAKAVKAAKA
jgi:uncharacterized protein with GYD domain